MSEDMCLDWMSPAMSSALDSDLVPLATSPTNHFQLQGGGWGLQQIAGPQTHKEVRDWLSAMHRWRQEEQRRSARRPLRSSSSANTGGSYYRALRSDWYFPSDENAYRLDRHNKTLLMAPCRDRAATVGFRTVAEAPMRSSSERSRLQRDPARDDYG